VATPPAIAHVDMDAFYAAVEQRDRPELRGRPVIVGADPDGRGVVAAASYEARAFGVTSAMPIRRAARLCPHAAFLPVDLDKYARVSAQIMALLAEFSPLVEAVSVDEAFVDLTGTERLLGPPAEAARAMKRRISDQTGLTASAGVATTKFVAKVASDYGKPDGLVVVPPGAEAVFLAPLPVERVWGVGRVLGRELGALGVRTVADLQRLPRETLVRRFGTRAGLHLHELAFGRDARRLEIDVPAKSIGAETTFDVDVREPRALQVTLRRHAERIARELRASDLSAAGVTVKIRYSDFRTITRAHTGEPTQDGLELFRRAAALLERAAVREAVRLIGLSASGLRRGRSGQLPLLDPATVRRERVARAVDRLNDRFGGDAVRPAILVTPPASTPRLDAGRSG
jgi:DNA polymerase-4